MRNNITYLDYAATTPVDPRVIEAMNPYFDEYFGNPSSIHRYGQQAENAIECARETISRGLNCSSDEIIFTSCGSESDNLALRGAALAGRNLRGAGHILISPVEHHAVSTTAAQLRNLFGFELEFLPVDDYGMVDPNDVAQRIRPDTAVVSVIFANNEIGTINPTAEIGSVCDLHNVPFHTDAVQATAYLPMDVQALHVDMLSIGAHKFYGPKGIGALFVRKGTPILPSQTGGGQEFGLRAGTHNVPYIVGMEKAFLLSQLEMDKRLSNIRPLRDQLVSQVLEFIADARLTGHPKERLPNHASFVFEGIDGNELLMMLDMEGFGCSSGSACRTGIPEPSEVLSAIGLPGNWSLGSLRVTLGVHTTTLDIENFTGVLTTLISRLRG